jgi:F-type H+-transporting ATPase subunit epsilon
MEPGKLHLTLVTPHGHLLFTGTDPKSRTPGILVDEVTAPGILGELGILPGHLPLLTYLKAGALTYRQGNEIRWLAVRGGLAEVGFDKVIVLADAAELAEEIDVERAKAALEKVAERLEAPGMLDDPDFLKTQRKHERALVRLAVAEKARKRA